MKLNPKSLSLLAFTLMAASSPVAFGQETAPSKLQLLTFNSSFDTGLLKPNGGTGELSPVDGALRVNTPANKAWAGVMVKAPGGKWDLSQYEYISIDIHNVDNKDIDVFVRVDNPGADGLKNCISERTFVAPDQRTTLTIPIRRVSNSPIKLWGMAAYPQGLYPSNDGLDPTNIIAIVAYTGKPTGDCKFDISNVYASGKYVAPTWLDMPEDKFFPFVDTFGQFIHKEWPGKVHDVAELKKARETETATLAADKGPKTWNKWGGWADGPTLDATGHFRTAKHDGRWWLVDPDGKLFFSAGMCSVRGGWATTPIEERENWFSDLPKNEGADKQFFSKSYKLWSGKYAGKEPMMFDFSGRNLQRKYGDDWKKTYPDIVHQRLRAWGINTMANWSDGAWTKMGKTPYMSTFFYESKKLRPTGSGFPDVFDPSFVKNVNAGAKQWLTSSANDPWCIGYFADNEMPWGGATQLAIDTLKAPANQPAKLEMIRWLKERYATIEELNKAWGTDFTAYDALPVGAALKAPPKSEVAIKDLTDFTDIISETYFKTVRDAVKAIAPNKLYLGCRSVGGSLNVIAMSVKYCDVVSYNRYCHSVRDQKLPGNIDGPTLIGEFHFGASDRGPFWNGLVSTDNQEDRGRKYADYVNSALDNPQIVGVHWFQYGDQAVTGRGDGENAQCGFVDVTDNPYKETIQSSRAVAEQMYQRRAAGTAAAR